MMLVAPPFMSRFRAHAVTFDGTNDYLTRGAGLTGAVDGKLLTASVWIRPAVDGTTMRVLRGTSTVGGTTNRGFSFIKGANNAFGMNATNSAGTNILQPNPADGSCLAGTWQHYMISVDLSSTSLRHYYKDGVNLAPPWTDYLNQDIDFTTADMAVGAQPSGADKFNGDMADLLVWPGVYLELSVEANRRLFISAAGKPVGPTNAIAALGTPIVGLYGAPTSTWHTNKGSGGGFTLTGALTDASTSPSN